MQRINYPDVIYKTSKERFNAVVDEIEEMYRKGRPVLVGTVSIERSEHISQLLKTRKIIHEVLNAKNHSREADIIAMTGHKSVVTIATNMAGRGTDIVLGDNVLELGGLHVIGTERHESRRIDNQLRGRSGRQGDKGSSRFYLSFEDDLMRIFGSDRIAGLMERLKMKEGEDIQSPLVNRAIETAQKRVEAHNFDIRKWLLKYDNVINKQREVIYAYRQMLLEEDALLSHFKEQAKEIVDNLIFDQLRIAEEKEDIFDGKELSSLLSSLFRLSISAEKLVECYKEDTLHTYIWDEAQKNFQEKIDGIDDNEIRDYIRSHFLTSLDKYWKDHLYIMDELRESVSLRAYGQIDPLHEYQKEGHRLFKSLIEQIKIEAVSSLFSVPMMQFDDEFFNMLKDAHEQKSKEENTEIESTEKDSSVVKSTYDFVLSTSNNKQSKIGRNDSCSCGSGKKYKKCCGR